MCNYSQALHKVYCVLSDYVLKWVVKGQGTEMKKKMILY